MKSFNVWNLFPLSSLPYFSYSFISSSPLPSSPSHIILMQRIISCSFFPILPLPQATNDPLFTSSPFSPTSRYSPSAATQSQPHSRFFPFIPPPHSPSSYKNIAYLFCPFGFSLHCTIPLHFFKPFFSLLDNFLSFLVQPILRLFTSNSLYFSCFSFLSLEKYFQKRKTFRFSSSQNFPVLENFFQVQRYKIIITSKQKMNFFSKKTQKKCFPPSPPPPFVH